jgi:hypothetical protein
MMHPHWIGPPATGAAPLPPHAANQGRERSFLRRLPPLASDRADRREKGAEREESGEAEEGGASGPERIDPAGRELHGQPARGSGAGERRHMGPTTLLTPSGAAHLRLAASMACSCEGLASPG